MFSPEECKFHQKIIVSAYLGPLHRRAFEPTSLLDPTLLIDA